MDENNKIEPPISNTNQPSLRVKQRKLYDMCHDYLIENFHKFTPANQLKVALTLAQKMTPTQNNTTLDGDLNARVTMMPSIKVDGKELEADIGD